VIVGTRSEMAWRSEMAHRKLDFVIAGAQKGGTTTLDAILRHHPQIQMASCKETHFFDDESRNWETPDYEELEAYFTEADQGLRGEATPITMYWRPAVRRLHDYNPDIKLILLLRNPIERAFSGWCMEYSAGRETMLFGNAIREGRERVRLSGEGEKERLHRCYSYVERGFYGRQLAQLFSFFPQRQIHCEISEEFFGDQTATLQRLSTFLEINAFPTVAPLHEFPRLALSYPSTLSYDDSVYLLELFRDDIRTVESLLGRSIREWLTPVRAQPLRPCRQ
jgi:hypothetical protein